MNWHRSRCRLACLLCVVAFCIACLVFAFGFGLFAVTRDGLLCTGPYQFTLEAPQSADGHVYALIN